MKKLFILFAFVCFLSSCNVTESIVFDKDMGGKYVTGFDMSPIMQMAAASGQSYSDDKEKKEKMDTTIVFNDLWKTHKDSIAALNAEQRIELEKLKGMVLDIEMDEEKNIFRFNMSKEFKKFDELKTIYDQTDEAMNYVKNMGNKAGQAPQEQMDELTKTEEVTFLLKGNTFSRFQPATAKTDDLNENEDKEVEIEDGEDGFKEQFMVQFDDMLANSYYTLIYTFPKRVKSVSKENAVVSEDGKTVTYKVPWNAINGDASLMNLDIVLED